MKFFLFISIFAILNCSDSSPAAGEDMPLPAETEKNQSIQIAAESVPPVIPECYPPALRKYSGMDGKFKKASDEFEKKNYKNAAKLFDEFNAAHPDDVLSAEAAFSSARSKIFLQEFDQALETIDNFISGKPGLYFEALAGIELSKIYRQLPYYGFRRDGKIFYNQEDREGEYVYLWHENFDKSVELRESARLKLIAVIRDPGKCIAGTDDYRLTAIQNNLDLAELLMSTNNVYDGYPPAEDIVPPKQDETYLPEWHPRKKILFLFDEAVAFNSGRADKHVEAQSKFKKALFLMTFPESPSKEWLKETDELRKKYESDAAKDKPPFKQPVFAPSPDIDPLVIIESIIRDYPGDPDTDLYFGTIGRIFEARQDFVEAVAKYEEFLKKFPKSKYVPDVKLSLQGIKAPSMSFSAQTVTYKGQKPAIGINARNLSKIRFSLCEIDLEDLLLRSANLNDPTVSFTYFEKNFGKLKGAKNRCKKTIKKWTEEIEDAGDFQYLNKNSELQIGEIGAYLLHAEAENIEQVQLIIHTDVIAVGKQDRGKMHYILTDAKTGAPVGNFPVTMKEIYWQSGWWSHEKVRIKHDKTDEKGRVTFTFTTGDNIYSNRVEFFAHKGRSSTIIPFQYAGHYYAYGKEPDAYKIFAFTDRPVYRTGDTAKFKLIVRDYIKGKNENAPEKDIHITITNPKGERIYERTLKTNEFGTVSGEAKIESEAPLGVYYVYAYIPGASQSSYMSSGSQFRVEEYKKPEFEVKVVPSANELRHGESATADITATYYFGAPVSGATVKYTITRSVYYHQYVRPTRFDWLYGSGWEKIYEKPYAGGEEFVMSGSGVTDEKGKLKITLPAAEKEAGHDFKYTVQTGVTDLSRRTIQGAGNVTVTKDPFFVYIYTRQGFYSPKDVIDVEVNAMTSSDAPVQMKGVLEVFRLTYPAGEEEKRELVHSEEISLDDAGRGFYGWKCGDEGQYMFVARGSYNNSPEVRREYIVNAVEKHFTPNRFKFREFDLTTEKRTYLRGEKIKILVSTPHKQATVWLTYEAGDEILEEKILELVEGSAILEVIADEKLSPNFFVRGVMVRDNGVFIKDREVFIPPGEEILDITVTPEKPDYKPGETGEFLLTVKDFKGKPVRAELSLAVFDSSVLYIQSETSGDIRPYYYGKRRYQNLYLQNSGTLWAMTLYENYNKYKEYEPAGLPFAYQYYGSAGWGYGTGGGYHYFTDGDYMEGANMKFKGGGGGLGMLRSLAAPDEVETKTAAKPASGEKAEEKMAMMDMAGDDAGKNKLFAAKAQTREFFPDTALFDPHVVTDAKGAARVRMKYPDSLTTWAVRAIGVNKGSLVGTASASTVTKKRITARIETPRFLVEGDKVTLAAVIRNDFEKEVEISVLIEVEGDSIGLSGASSRKISLKPHTEERIDFSGYARTDGEAVVKLSALSKDESDVLMKKFPVMVYGSEKMVTQGLIIKDGGKGNLKFDVPEKRDADSTRLTLVMEPSVAGIMLQSLPYLISYPYGCIEQTTSRFIPLALTAQILKEHNIKLSSLGRLSEKGNLAAPLSEQQDVRLFDEPVFDDQTLEKWVRKGLQKIYSFQKGDGGFGWWSGFESDPYMTAYVVMALMDARDAGVEVNSGVIDRGLGFLLKKFKKDKSIESRNYMGYVLARGGKIKSGDLDDVFNGRDALTPYGKSLLALALHHAGDKKKSGLLIENLENLAWVDEKNGTASFKQSNNYWWYWWHDRVEAVAWALRAFITIAPENRLNDMFAKWLILNRQGNRWYSTKDTAMAVYSLSKYIAVHKEFEADYEAKVSVNGAEMKKVRFSKENLFSGDGVLVLSGSSIPSGELELSFETNGKGRMYATAFLEYFSKEEKIKGSGNEIFVKREYFRLTPTVVKKKTWRGEIDAQDYLKTKIEEGEEIKSGDLIEVKLSVESKNDYEYLVFEDFKAAGFEPVELKSGYIFEHGAHMNMELRDKKVVFFMSGLKQGTQAITYKMRAEIPGKFNALPHKAYAMYAPRVRAISDSNVIDIVP